jgi:hypothetical protein
LDPGSPRRCNRMRCHLGSNNYQFGKFQSATITISFWGPSCPFLLTSTPSKTRTRPIGGPLGFRPLQVLERPCTCRNWMSPTRFLPRAGKRCRVLCHEGRRDFGRTIDVCFCCIVHYQIHAAAIVVHPRRGFLRLVAIPTAASWHASTRRLPSHGTHTRYGLLNACKPT